MQSDQLEGVWRRCEDALARGGPVDLRELGFWRAVAAVKRDRALIAAYAERIGAIDQRAFDRATPGPRLGLAVGALTLGAGALAGLVAVGFASCWRGWRRDLALLSGLGLLLATTHDLAHLVVGWTVGIRFSGWFLDGPTRVQPGLKTDYGSYLRTTASRRAAMHASGALATKVVPFALLPRARSRFTRGAVVGAGLLGIATDVLFSTRTSDWKRARRELRVARAVAAQ